MPQTSKKNIYQRMAEVMRAVSYVQKGDKQVNNQYTFVSHDAVVAKLRGPMLDAGIVYTVDVVKHEQNGNTTEAYVAITFVNIDDPADCFTVHGLGYGVDKQDKGPGKAVSYAVKYILLKTFALETGDDPERDLIEREEPHGDPPKTNKKPPPMVGEDGEMCNKKQLDIIHNLCQPDQANIRPDKFMIKLGITYGVEKSEELTRLQAVELIGKLQKIAAENKAGG